MNINSTRKHQTPRTGFTVGQGDAVTAWAMSSIRATYYPGEVALAEDRVNYRFINGFVDVGDLPCRVALWKEIKSRTVVLPDVIPVMISTFPASIVASNFPVSGIVPPNWSVG